MDPQIQQQLDTLSARIAALEHKPINFNSDIIGTIEVVTSTPTATAVALYDQLKLYSDGVSTFRLYVYDPTNNIWCFVALGT